MHQISKIYFVIKLYMFRASSVPIIRSYLLYTQQLVRFRQVMWPLPSRVRLKQFQPDSARKRSHNLHETYQLPCVQQITPDDGQRRCPKHVEFYDKINFGYLMRLVGCFIRSAPVLRFVFGLMKAQWAETCRRIVNIDYQYMLCLLTVQI